METAKLILRDQEYEVKAGRTVRAALRDIEVNSESVLVIRNGELITDDEILQPGENLRLVAVMSGG